MKAVRGHSFMWNSPGEILADLNSGVVGRIASGLRDLEEVMDAVIEEFELPPLDISLLKPFGASPPTEVLLSFVRLLDSYGSFRPKISPNETLYRITDLAITYGQDRIALEAALSLKSDRNKAADRVRWVLGKLRARGLHSQQEILGAGRYLSYLLDGEPQVRAAVLRGLKDWTEGALEDAVEFIRPELEPAEARLLFP